MNHATGLGGEAAVVVVNTSMLGRRDGSGRLARLRLEFISLVMRPESEHLLEPLLVWDALVTNFELPHMRLLVIGFFLRVPVAVIWGKSPVPASAIGRVHCKVAMSAQLSPLIVWVLVEPRKS